MIAITNDDFDTEIATATGPSTELIDRIRNPNDWFEAATEKLRSICGLNHDWDSYGANKPNSLAIHYAHAFLDWVQNGPGVDAPAITPAPNGNICFEWETSEGSLLTEIDDRGRHSFYFEKNEIDKEGKTFDNSEVLDLLSQI